MPSSLIPQSSIKSDKVSSVTGFYNTKLRCSLGAHSINALVFLEHIFQKETRTFKVHIF